MSPVLEVAIPSGQGSSVLRVLKLYDRRFGTPLRDDYNCQHVPHTQAKEAAFQTFVRQRRMPTFLHELDLADETQDVPPLPRRFLDGTSEGYAKYEAAMWRQCNEHFRCETEAYKRLGDLQGKSIPRMLASVRLVADNYKNNRPTDIQQGEASYFEIWGILLERISGYNLQDITTSPQAPPAGDLMRWQQIIQSTVNLTHNINQRGVIMRDCAPRNVVVDRHSQKPHIIDFAQCRFRDKMVRSWHEWGWHEEDETWDPDVEYWEQVGAAGNPRAIGAPMVQRVQKAAGVILPITYPDYRDIITGIRHRKAAKRRRAVPRCALGEDNGLS
ncbi:hypothetical protein NEMBOFW57_001098 [Staphylotrichum longicolle]|uniref:Protein kinase domain-containing protein n=1 Tax=Staphylotrichum longicolle TaxID=669026 RepID=A0AAD4F0I9_9PEZI|nr:hypothetical protein NEMBOFW57_001098 [Staphylotrichum longicolle]